MKDVTLGLHPNSAGGIWPVIYSATLLPGADRQSPVPAYPCLVIRFDAMYLASSFKLARHIYIVDVSFLPLGMQTIGNTIRRKPLPLTRQLLTEEAGWSLPPFSWAPLRLVPT